MTFRHRLSHMGLALLTALLIGLASQVAWSQANVIAKITVEGTQFVSPDGVIDPINELCDLSAAWHHTACFDEIRALRDWANCSC